MSHSRALRAIFAGETSGAIALTLLGSLWRLADPDASGPFTLGALILLGELVEPLYGRIDDLPATTSCQERHAQACRLLREGRAAYRAAAGGDSRPPVTQTDSSGDGGAALHGYARMHHDTFQSLINSEVHVDRAKRIEGVMREQSHFEAISYIFAEGDVNFIYPLLGRKLSIPGVPLAERIAIELAPHGPSWLGWVARGLLVAGLDDDRAPPKLTKIWNQICAFDLKLDLVNDVLHEVHAYYRGEEPERVPVESCYASLEKMRLIAPLVREEDGMMALLGFKSEAGGSLGDIHARCIQYFDKSIGLNHAQVCAEVHAAMAGVLEERSLIHKRQMARFAPDVSYGGMLVIPNSEAAAELERCHGEVGETLKLARQLKKIDRSRLDAAGGRSSDKAVATPAGTPPPSSPLKDDNEPDAKAKAAALGIGKYGRLAKPSPDGKTMTMGKNDQTIDLAAFRKKHPGVCEGFAFSTHEHPHYACTKAGKKGHTTTNSGAHALPKEAKSMGKAAWQALFFIAAATAPAPASTCALAPAWMGASPACSAASPTTNWYASSEWGARPTPNTSVSMRAPAPLVLQRGVMSAAERSCDLGAVQVAQPGAQEGALLSPLIEAIRAWWGGSSTDKVVPKWGEPGSSSAGDGMAAALASIPVAVATPIDPRCVILSDALAAMQGGTLTDGDAGDLARAAGITRVSAPTRAAVRAALFFLLRPGDGHAAALASSPGASSTTFLRWVGILRDLRDECEALGGVVDDAPVHALPGAGASSRAMHTAPGASSVVPLAEPSRLGVLAAAAATMPRPEFDACALLRESLDASARGQLHDYVLNRLILALGQKQIKLGTQSAARAALKVLAGVASREEAQPKEGATRRSFSRWLAALRDLLSDCEPTPNAQQPPPPLLALPPPGLPGSMPAAGAPSSEGICPRASPRLICYPNRGSGPVSGVPDAATFRREPNLDERVPRVLALEGPSGGSGSEARAGSLHATPLAVRASRASLRTPTSLASPSASIASPPPSPPTSAFANSAAVVPVLAPAKGRESLMLMAFRWVALPSRTVLAVGLPLGHDDSSLWGQVRERGHRDDDDATAKAWASALDLPAAQAFYLFEDAASPKRVLHAAFCERSEVPSLPFTEGRVAWSDASALGGDLRDLADLARGRLDSHLEPSLGQPINIATGALAAQRLVPQQLLAKGQHTRMSWGEVAATAQDATNLLREAFAKAIKAATGVDTPLAHSLSGWADRLLPPPLEDVPEEVRAMAMRSSDHRLASEPYPDHAMPVATPPLPPKPPPPDQRRVPKWAKDWQHVWLPQSYHLLVASMRAHRAHLRAVGANATGVGQRVKVPPKPPVIALGPEALQQWARSIVESGEHLVLEGDRIVILDRSAVPPSHFNTEYIGQHVLDQSDDNALRDAILTHGMIFAPGVRMPPYFVVQPNMESMADGFSTVHSELLKMRERGWYRQSPDRLDSGLLDIDMVPAIFNPNGAVPRALSNIFRRILDGYAPRQPEYVLKLDELLAVPVPGGALGATPPKLQVLIDKLLKMRSYRETRWADRSRPLMSVNDASGMSTSRRVNRADLAEQSRPVLRVSSAQQRRLRVRVLDARGRAIPYDSDAHVASRDFSARAQALFCRPHADDSSDVVHGLAHPGRIRDHPQR